jgi:hypothetical protein
VYNGYLWDSKKVAVVQSLWQRWFLFAFYSHKPAISFGRLGLKLEVVDKWSLFRDGRRFDCIFKKEKMYFLHSLLCLLKFLFALF